MKTKIVYVITSTPDDVYLEQTYLSIYSLWKHEENPHVVLLTDNRTNETLKGDRAKILELVAEKIVVPFDENVTNMRRSRWLKTKMRSLVEGDFMYIDGDTIINSSLAEIDDCPLLIGSVEDAHRPLDVHYGKEKLLRQAKTLGFSIDGEQYYFNGGVFYVKDCKETHDFFDRWHENWKMSVEHGINQDMPALILTNIQMKHTIQKLDGKWNCQLMYGFNYFTTAKIIHYFASRYTTNNGGYIYEFMDPKILEDIKKTWKISPEFEAKLDHPLSCFSERVELIGGTDVDILNTQVYKTIRLIYNKYPKVFAFMQSILYKVNKINKRKNE